MRFKLSTHSDAGLDTYSDDAYSDDAYLTSATIMNFITVLDILKIITINSAFHSKGFLHVNIE
jgi:hypothetical protein